MKKISYKVNRSATGGPRKARGKMDKVKSLNITSLVDILTILLVFLIKNVSMDAQNITVPETMKLPTTVSHEELERSGMSVVMKVFPDMIFIGSDNISVGSPEEFMTDQSVRDNLISFMRQQSAQISQNPDLTPVLLIQADNQIRCRYITELVGLSAHTGFPSIYFSTIKGDDPQMVFGL
jgi:biopolymer transport protein TolR